MRKDPGPSTLPTTATEHSEKPEHTPEEGGLGWLALIRELAYDLVGRVIPGTVVIVALAHGVGGLFPSLAPLESSWLTPLLVVIPGYLFGLLGDIVADATVDRLLAFLYGSKFSFWRHVDHLTDVNHQRALLKMWAERVCVWNLLLGWVCLWMARPTPLDRVSNEAWVVITVLLALLWLRWDWCCRSRARTWAENWKRGYGSYKVRGD